MVSTRRSTANAAPAIKGTTPSKSTQSADDTIHVLLPSSSRPVIAPITPKLSGTALSVAPSDTISEHDLSLTSPSTSRTPMEDIMETPRKLDGTPRQFNAIPSSTLRILAPRSTIGSAHNPIIVIEDSPPLVTARARKRKHHRKSEPHKFLDRGYRKLYSYRSSRPALDPKPANGSTFTGHQSHDIYRMMNAKMAAESAWNTNGTSGYAGRGVPFEMQYPLSTQYLTQQSGQGSHVAGPYTQYYSHQAPPPDNYPVLPSQNEEMLRKKAVQYIREYSRPSPRKRRLSNTDPDETSSSECEQPTTATRTSPIKSTPRLNLASPSSLSISTLTPKNSKLNVFHDHDPNFDITQLIEHTSLLTSLLHIYQHSTDQKGVREDISMLVSVQNKRVAEWLKTESETSRKRKKANTDSASATAIVNSAVQTQQRLEHEKKWAEDNELRQVLSATANMWQDGSGEGVADVFAARFSSSSSSPVVGTGFDARLVSAGDDPVGKDMRGGRVTEGKTASSSTSVVVYEEVDRF